MTKKSFPDFNYAWAEGGNKVSPQKEHIQRGWGVERPIAEHQNFLNNRLDVAIQYISQQGVPEWNSKVDYYAPTSHVVGSNGELFRAIKDNGVSTEVIDPVLDTTNQFWQKVIATSVDLSSPNGANLVGFDSNLTYNAGTVGYALKNNTGSGDWQKAISDLREDIANSKDRQYGSGMVGYNKDLPYKENTAGYQLKENSENILSNKNSINTININFNNFKDQFENFKADLLNKTDTSKGGALVGCSWSADYPEGTLAWAVNKVSTNNTKTQKNLDDFKADLANTVQGTKNAGMIGFNPRETYPDNTLGEYVKNNSGMPILSVMWWNNSNERLIPTGWLPANGQKIMANSFPALKSLLIDIPPAWSVIGDDEWIVDWRQRGKFGLSGEDTDASPLMIRLPDLNGEYQDSKESVFLRGGGMASSTPSSHVYNEIVRDSIGDAKVPVTTSPQNTAHAVRWYDHKTRLACAFNFRNTGWNEIEDLNVASLIRERENIVNFGSEETAPVHLRGCWIIKVFGATVNSGTVDIEQLMKEYSTVVTRLGELEGRVNAKKYTIVYPNNGTLDTPASIYVNQQYVVDNPFGTDAIICHLELLYGGYWGSAGWSYNDNGAIASQLGDKIIVSTGATALVQPFRYSGTSLKNLEAIVQAPCRVKVWRAV